MSEHDALIRAIVEHPAEDTPRLMFADWLDEHADSFANPAQARQRAAFIRDDIAAAQRDEFDPARLRWELIEKPLREREPWVRETLPATVRSVPGSVSKFRRGFPWYVRVTPTQFLDNPERFAALPAPTFSFVTSFAVAEELFESPHFARFAGLHVESTYLRSQAVQALAEWPQAAGLQELCVGPSGVAVGAVSALLRSNLLARLTRFDLNTQAGLGPTVLNGLHRLKSSRLREVSFAGSGLPGAQVERVLDAPIMQGVVRLSLAMNRLALTGYEALTRAELPNLRALDLSATSPGAEGLRLLSTSATLARLQRLSFANNHVNRALAAELASCHELSHLRVLDLSANAIGNSGAAALARSLHLTELLVLDLGHSQVGDEGIEAILESPLADTLVLLNLCGSPASKDMKEVVKARMGDRVRVWNNFE